MTDVRQLIFRRVHCDAVMSMAQKMLKKILKMHQLKNSLILLSGGLDSAANLAIGVEYNEIRLALTIRYGQKSQEKEAEAAQALCQYYQVKHEVLELPWLARLGHNALTGAKTKLPLLKPHELDDPEITQKSAKAVWVPNRNGVFINIAAAFAEHFGLERVVVGFNREEAATFPDNSIEFLKKSTESLFYSTASRVQVYSYTAELNKKEIVEKLRELQKPFPFDKVWSCYEGGTKPCGQCESCQRYLRAVA